MSRSTLYCRPVPDWRDNTTIKARQRTLTANQCIKVCRDLLNSSAWSGTSGTEAYEGTELQLGQWLQFLYWHFDEKNIRAALQKLPIGPALTILADRLNMMAMAEKLADYEANVIEIESAEDLRAAIERSDLPELTAT